MAAFILFVYPQQTEFEQVDFGRINIDGFHVHEGTPTSNPKRFCSRIRNGLSHGRFRLADGQIELTDQKRDGSDSFCTTISVGKFGDFINQFMLEAKNQHFKTR